jgi:hypothetical protein
VNPPPDDEDHLKRIHAAAFAQHYLALEKTGMYLQPYCADKALQKADEVMLNYRAAYGRRIGR